MLCLRIIRVASHCRYLLIIVLCMLCITCLMGRYIIVLNASFQAPFTHAWTPEKNRLILIILQCNTEHKNIFLHIPGLKITQIKIPQNVVDDFGTLTTWRHMKTSSLKRKDQTSFDFAYASILIKFNKNKFAR